MPFRNDVLLLSVKLGMLPNKPLSSKASILQKIPKSMEFSAKKSTQSHPSRCMTCCLGFSHCLWTSLDPSFKVPIGVFSLPKIAPNLGPWTLFQSVRKSSLSRFGWLIQTIHPQQSCCEGMEFWWFLQLFAACNCCCLSSCNKCNCCFACVQGGFACMHLPKRPLRLSASCL